MFNNNYISFLLDLKDPNLDFSETTCEIVKIKNVETKVISATLKNKPHKCPYCEEEKIIIHGYKTSKIRLLPSAEYNVILKLKKQRYKCKCCGKTFISKTDEVAEHCQISKKVKLAIYLKTQEKISEKDIAKQYNVSSNTINRVIKAAQSYNTNYNYLPESLCFDEFKSTKDAEGAMSFIFVDAKTHKIVDILENRKLSKLIKYFMRYSKKARDNVKFIVMDMYTPYISLVKECFRNAQIIFDKFHIVNLLSRALDKTRIKVMNEQKENYNKFKRYYKLLLKKAYELDQVHYEKRICFNKMMSQSDIVDYLLEQDKELKNTYKIYQEILYAINFKKPELLEKLIDSNVTGISEKMQTALKTLKKHKEYIINAIKYDLNNGVIEGINNKIKALKRVAFGYRSFYNFRKRIFLINQ